MDSHSRNINKKAKPSKISHRIVISKNQHDLLVQRISRFIEALPLDAGNKKQEKMTKTLIFINAQNVVRVHREYIGTTSANCTKS
jgi:hypothetical protein